MGAEETLNTSESIARAKLLIAELLKKERLCNNRELTTQIKQSRQRLENLIAQLKEQEQAIVTCKQQSLQREKEIAANQAKNQLKLDKAMQAYEAFKQLELLEEIEVARQRYANILQQIVGLNDLSSFKKLWLQLLKKIYAWHYRSLEEEYDHKYPNKNCPA
jgi:hypothetical protein